MNIAKEEFKLLLDMYKYHLFESASSFYTWESIRYRLNENHSISNIQQHFWWVILNWLENTFIIRLSWFFDKKSDKERQKTISIQELLSYFSENHPINDLVKSKISNYWFQIDNLKKIRNKFRAHKSKELTLSWYDLLFKECYLTYQHISDLIDLLDEIYFDILNAFDNNAKSLYIKWFSFKDLKSNANTVLLNYLK